MLCRVRNSKLGTFFKTEIKLGKERFIAYADTEEKSFQKAVRIAKEY